MFKWTTCLCDCWMLPEFLEKLRCSFFVCLERPIRYKVSSEISVLWFFFKWNTCYCDFTTKSTADTSFNRAWSKVRRCSIELSANFWSIRRCALASFCLFNFSLFSSRTALICASMVRHSSSMTFLFRDTSSSSRVIAWEILVSCLKIQSWLEVWYMFLIMTTKYFHICSYWILDCRSKLSILYLSNKEKTTVTQIVWKYVHCTSNKSLLYYML